MINEIKWRHTANKMVFVLFVNSDLNMKRWKGIILSLGVKADIPHLIIAKCFARNAIAKKQTNIDVRN